MGIRYFREFMFTYDSTECSINLNKKQSQNMLNIASKISNGNLGKFKFNYNTKINAIYYRGLMDEPHHIYHDRAKFEEKLMTASEILPTLDLSKPTIKVIRSTLKSPNESKTNAKPHVKSIKYSKNGNS